MHAAARLSLAVLAGLLATGMAGAAPQERADQVLVVGNDAGSETVSTAADGTTRATFSYHDRGRGEQLVASWRLDAGGRPLEYSVEGVDYMHAPVHETFRLSGGKASWQSRVGQGERTPGAAAFYFPAAAPPEFLGVLVRALLKAPAHRLALLPAGEVSLERIGPPAPGTPAAAIPGIELYHISGLALTPTAVWLDRSDETAAIASDWLSLLTPATRGMLPALLAAQSQAQSAWAARLAREQMHTPSGDLVIRGARLFDPRDLTVTAGTSVHIRGERIVRVAADGELAAPPGAEILDAHGRFLMPGLWDNHQHFVDHTGVLDIVNGVTSARDMANDTDEFLERLARFEARTEIGPRVWRAGIIDGTGEFAGPTKMRVDTAAEALADVAWYADHGYRQIKIYSSVPPPLVPVIADAAHARGMRVSGHVPAFMSARQFIVAGADEIQHLNFVVLNFLVDQVPDTRNINRFTAVAEHAAELGPEQPQVREFIAFLRERHTVLDPTVGVFESIFCGDPAALNPALAAVAPRLPAPLRPSLLSSALSVPPGEEAAYRAALPALLRLLQALHAAGVTLLPGTDVDIAGYPLHHELTLYVRAGIPAAEVLRLATLTSAQVVGVDGERGVIAPGKLADLILVRGDPSVRIADIDNIDVVIAAGRVFEPAHIERSLGITPRSGG